jgi:hypothetical protein
MRKPSTEELNSLLEGVPLKPLGRELMQTVWNKPPLGPSPPRLPIGLGGAFSDDFSQTQIYLNNAIYQLGLIFLVRMQDSGVRYIASWPYETSAVWKVASSKDGVTSARAKFRPMLLCVLKGRVIFRDAYPESYLVPRSTSDNPLFRKVGDVWHCDARNEALADLGIEYEIFSDPQFGRALRKNMAILYRYALDDYVVKDEVACKVVIDLLAVRGFLLKVEIIDKGLLSAEDLNYLVATYRVYVPLLHADFFDIQTSAIYRDEVAYHQYLAERAALNGGYLRFKDGETVTEGKLVLWGDNEAVIGKITEEHVNVISNGEPHPFKHAVFALMSQDETIRVKPLNPTDLPPMRPTESVAAQFRIDVVTGRVEAKWPEDSSKKKLAGKPISKDTVAEWTNWYEIAKEKGEDVYEALRPDHHRQGRHGTQVPQTEHILQDVISGALKKGDTTTIAKIFTEYEQRSEAEGHGEDQILTYKSVRQRIHNLHPSVYVCLKKGRTAAYEISRFSQYKDRDIFLDGEVNCLVAQADHYNVDMTLEHSLSHKVMEGKALWLSVLVNLEPHFPLAYALTPHRPNSATVHLLMLDCIRRNGFLPPFIILDNEGNFDCRALHAILRHCESSVLWRPSYDPRYGSGIESFFKKLSVQLLRGLVGNYVGVQNFDRLAAARLARNKDLMTIPEFDTHLEAFFFNYIYDTPTNLPSGFTPREYIENSRRYDGQFHLRPAAITDNFRRMCMPPLTAEGRRLIYGGGTVVGQNIVYNSTELVKFEGRYCFVHPDLFKGGTANVFVPHREVKELEDNEPGQWFTAVSDFAETFGCLSYAELQSMLTETRKWGGFKDRKVNPWLLNQKAAQGIKAIYNDPQRQEKRYRHQEALLSADPSLRAQAGPQVPDSQAPVLGKPRLVHSQIFDASKNSFDPKKSI